MSSVSSQFFQYDKQFFLEKYLCVIFTCSTKKMLDSRYDKLISKSRELEMITYNSL